MLKFVRLVILTLILQIALISNAYAQFFLHDEAHLFVDAAVKARTIGIEIEFAGVPDDVTIRLIKKHFGGRGSHSDEENMILLFNTKSGPVKLKVEGSAWRFESSGLEKIHDAQLEEDYKMAPREIVLPPLRYEDLPKAQALLDDLKAAGAQGTSPELAISLQANIQMGDLLASQKNVDDLVNLMRVYFKKDHIKQSRALLNIPEIRQEFLQDLSPGFMKVLENPNYKPTARRLYDDFMYRQSLELLGHKNAWVLPISAVRKQLLEYDRDSIVVQRVVKMSKLRVSSLLLDAFREDPLSQVIIRSEWARPAPIVEFRE
ncbi:MAG: amidoligase family protein, partial [Bdellovibrionales bacterium]|nr:amidoligase family protein [Bdellovibrionales bacterium]